MSRQDARQDVLSMDDFGRWLIRRYRYQTVVSTLRWVRQLHRRMGVSLDELASMQAEVVNYILSQRWTGGTKHGVLGAYVRFLRYASQPLIPETREALRTLQRLRERKIPRIPRYETAQAAVAASRGRFKIVLALGLYAGLRLSEALSLRWTQIDLTERRLIIEQSEKRSEGSILPIPEPLYAILATAKRTDEYVCRISPRSAWRCMSLLRRRLLKQGFADAEFLNFKNLRHVYGTSLYAKTQDLIYVQRMLRHRSILTTQRYVHLITDAKTYDVRVVEEDDVETIKTLLSAGYNVSLQTKRRIYLRRAIV